MQRIRARPGSPPLAPIPITELLVGGGANNLVVLVSESGEGAPSTSNVKQAMVGLDVNFLASHGQLIVLELLKAFLLPNVQTMPEL